MHRKEIVMKLWRRLLISLGSLTAVLWTAAAWAQEAATPAAQKTGIAAAGDGGWMAIAIGLALGAAAFGGATGQGRTAAAAVEGLARNPSVGGRLIVPMSLGL